MITFGSVCSGIEASSVAWLPLGWRPVFHAEIEAAPSAVLAHHYPNVPNYGDFTCIETAPEPIDILVGGTPCQSFSVAGKRLGMDDPRGNLAIEFLRLARRLGPRWLVWENVPGVLSSSGGRDLGAFLGLLAECGYGWAYRVLDAQYFGVPQRRRRVFVVGHLGDWRRAVSVLFEREGLCGHPAPGRGPESDVAPAITPGARRASGARSGEQLTVDSVGSYGDHARALTAHACPRYDLDTDTLVAHTLRADGFDASEDGTGRGTPLVPVAIRTANTSANGAGFAENLAHTLDGANGQAIAYQCHGNNVGPMGSLRSGDGGLTSGVPFAFNWQTGGDGRLGYADTPTALQRQQTPALHQGSAVRRLTPCECERLQGFPDDWTLVPYRGKPMADGLRYKMLGNSMAVPVMAWIGRRLIEAIEIQEGKP